MLPTPESSPESGKGPEEGGNSGLPGPGRLLAHLEHFNRVEKAILRDLEKLDPVAYTRDDGSLDVDLLQAIIQERPDDAHLRQTLDAYRHLNSAQ